MRIHWMKLAMLTGLLIALPARAGSIEKLHAFIEQTRSAKANFSQEVIDSNGSVQQQASGTVQFQRPGKFRWTYDKPYEQVIVGDGESVWLYDVDLQQVTVRAMDQALGATPAALLAGANVEKDFELKAQPSVQGLDWVQATPRIKGEAASFQSLRVGFKGKALSAIELVDNFGQRSLLTFGDVATNVAPPADAFRFTPPKGVEVLRQ